MACLHLHTTDKIQKNFCSLEIVWGQTLYYTIDNGILYFSSEISLGKYQFVLTKNLTFFNNFIKHTATDYDRTTQFNEILQMKEDFAIFQTEKKRSRQVV